MIDNANLGSDDEVDVYEPGTSGVSNISFQISNNFHIEFLLFFQIIGTIEFSQA